MSIHTRQYDKRTDTLDDDLLYQVLSNERRRLAIRELAVDAPLEKTTLAERIAATEQRTSPDRLGTQERKRVVVSLHQCHRPKLRAARIITVDDTGAGELWTRGPNFEVAAAHVAPGHQPLTDRLRLTVAGLLG
jgi:hypothetical protein